MGLNAPLSFEIEVIKIDIASTLCITFVAYNTCVLLEYAITKTLISMSAYFLYLIVLMAAVLACFLIIEDNRDENEGVNKESALGALSLAHPMDISQTGVTIKPELAGLIVLRDSKFINELVGESGCREIKIAIDGDCFLEGIGVPASKVEDYEMPYGIDAIAFLSDTRITGNEFLGYHTYDSVKENPADNRRGWMNVLEYDESGASEVSAFITPTEREVKENVFAMLKEWRDTHIG